MLLASLIGVAGAASPVHNPYAGVRRMVAVRQATEVARSWPLPFQDEFATSRDWVVRKVLRQTSSTGAEAWLVLFDALNANEADEACIWVWRTGPTFSFEETPSVIWGRSSDLVHERCVSEITANKMLDPEQVVGDDETWDVANPEPVTLFGPVSRGSYPGDAIDTSGVSLTAIPARFPSGTSPGTSGLSGFVIDGKTWKPVRDATIWIWPSAESSGRLSTAAPNPPVTAVTNPDLAVIRFHGRNAENWKKKGITAAERFDYRYSQQELLEWVPRIRKVAEQARETHLLMNNCYGDKAVNNAAELSQMLLSDGVPS